MLARPPSHGLFKAGVAAFLCLSCLPVSAEDKIDLSCQISVPARVTAGRALLLEFTLNNRGKKAVNVLTWNTPLEGLFGKAFVITTGDEEVPYAGPMVKRGSVSREDYVNIPPGGRRAARVNLADAYDLKTPGRYTVTFGRKLLDATTAKIPRSPGEHTAYDLRCPAATFEVVKAAR